MKGLKELEEEFNANQEDLLRQIEEAKESIRSLEDIVTIQLDERDQLEALIEGLRSDKGEEVRQDLIKMNAKINTRKTKLEIIKEEAELQRAFREQVFFPRASVIVSPDKEIERLRKSVEIFVSSRQPPDELGTVKLPETEKISELNEEYEVLELSLARKHRLELERFRGTIEGLESEITAAREEIQKLKAIIKGALGIIPELDKMVNAQVETKKKALVIRRERSGLELELSSMEREYISASVDGGVYKTSELKKIPATLLRFGETQLPTVQISMSDIFDSPRTQEYIGKMQRVGLSSSWGGKALGELERELAEVDGALKEISELCQIKSKDLETSLATFFETYSKFKELKSRDLAAQARIEFLSDMKRYVEGRSRLQDSEAASLKKEIKREKLARESADDTLRIIKDKIAIVETEIKSFEDELAGLVSVEPEMKESDDLEGALLDVRKQGKVLRSHVTRFASQILGEVIGYTSEKSILETLERVRMVYKKIKMDHVTTKRAIDKAQSEIKKLESMISENYEEIDGNIVRKERKRGQDNEDGDDKWRKELGILMDKIPRIPYKMLMNKTEYREKFREFLEIELAAENLEFVIEVAKYKKTKKQNMIDTADRIFKRFVVEQSPRMINIKSSTRSNCATLVKNHRLPDPEIFDECHREVTHLMSHDSLARFVKSKQYYELLKDSNLEWINENEENER